MGNKTYKFTTYTSGPVNQPPVADLAVTQVDALLGSIIQLDGRGSRDPENQPLSYLWSFVQVPIGSEVEASGFRNIRPNGAAVSFIPDKTGFYVVQLVVNDGELNSGPITATVNIQLSRVPNGEGLVPDPQFLWSYISNFWQLVEDREVITSIWSSVVQMVGAELIKLWSNDYNKSLATIQSSIQRRWQRFVPQTDLTGALDQRVIVGKNQDGTGGRSGRIGATPGVGTTSVFYVPYGNGELDKADFTQLLGNYGPSGRVISINGVGYTIDRVSNENLTRLSGADLVGLAGTSYVRSGSTLVSGSDLNAAPGSIVTSAGSTFQTTGVVGGDYLVIETGVDAGTYPIVSVDSETQLTISGTLAGFAGEDFKVIRSTAQFVTGGVTTEDHLVIKTGVDKGTYAIISVDSEIQLTVAYLGTTTPVSFSGFTSASFEVVEPFSLVAVKEAEIPDGLVGATWRVPNLLHVPTVDLEDAGVRAGDILVFEVTRADTKTSAELRAQIVAVDGSRVGFQFTLQDLEPGSSILDHRMFRQLARDLRLVPLQATDVEAAAAGEALLAYMPVGINLATRPFSVFRVTFLAKKIIHNTALAIPDEVISIPALQEQVSEPPVVLRENLDYEVVGGLLTFTGGLFTLSDPSPDELWAETAFYDNSGAIERNFGRLVSLSQDDLSESRTRAPYLSAVKGLFFAYTNGPTLSNIRLGLQILLGLPFTEERGVLLEVQPEFTTDSSGRTLGRVLIEDVDDKDRRLGVRRVYYYPTVVGLEVNPVTGATYAEGDIIEAFQPLSAGIEVTDYIKDPRWWERAIYGTEVLKYFLFKVAIDSDVFDSDDVVFAYDFLRRIKPAYTRVITAALLSLADDIEAEDALAGAIAAKMYDSPWGLEATLRLDDYNHQGVVLWPAGSLPLSTRTLHMLTDIRTFKYYDSGLGKDVVRAYSETGFGSTLLRARDAAAAPMMEGDILVIHKGQAGASSTENAFYEIGEVVSNNELRLLIAAPKAGPTTFGVGAAPAEPELDPDLFEYGESLSGSIVRRPTFGCVRKGSDLETIAASSEAHVPSGLLNDGVSPGHHLIIESGVDKGEYYIDEVSTDPPYISDTAMLLRNLPPGAFGGWASVSDATGLDYWVLDPRQRPASVGGAKSVYTGSRIELEVLDPSTAVEFHLFTPGMVGTVIEVSNSDDPSNDGRHIITAYISPGKVALDSSSTTSDTAAQAIIHF